MKILFAPDWREGVPYQRLLAEALQRQSATVDFLRDYKRVFPLRRLLATRPCDILHLHWPEAYYPRKRDAWDWFRRMRFAWDIRAATRHCRLATTAHNLHAHNRGSEPFAHRNTRAAHQRAGVVFAHSERAKTKLIEAFSLLPEKVRVIPHGDLSVTLGEPIPRADARAKLELDPDAKIALMFGTVEPYKGQEEVIAWWREHQPDCRLAIVGKPITPEYGATLEALAIFGTKDIPKLPVGVHRRWYDYGILTRFAWLPDDELRLWLSAADLTIFNYRAIFTSGAANLARSWGVPILLPHRLDTVVLDEPSPFVHRFTDFQNDFGSALEKTLAVSPDFAAAASWRAACSWDEVARLTVQGYQSALSS